MPESISISFRTRVIYKSERYRKISYQLGPGSKSISRAKGAKYLRGRLGNVKTLTAGGLGPT